MDETTPRARANRDTTVTRRATRPGVVSLPDQPRRGGRRTITDGANALQVQPFAPPDQAYPDQAYPGRAEPDQAEPGRASRGPARAQALAVPVRESRRGAPAAAGPRLRVAPPLPVAVPRAPFVALVLVIVVVGVLGVLVINTKINENAFALDQLHQSQDSLDLQEQQLARDLAEAEAPGNLAAQARRLGLVPAGTPAFIRLPDGKVLGVPQPATNAPSVTSQAGD